MKKKSSSENPLSPEEEGKKDIKAIRAQLRIRDKKRENIHKAIAAGKREATTQETALLSVFATEDAADRFAIRQIEQRAVRRIEEKNIEPP